MKSIVQQLNRILNEGKARIRLQSDIKSADGIISKGTVVTIMSKKVTSKNTIYNVEVITGDTAEIIVPKNQKFPHKFM